MELLSAYVPIDRYLALVNGKTLPDRTQGAALFVDISGFTPLTDALVRNLGPLKGAEELTRHLNLVYDALIGELYQYGGSVISFSGDAITCWLDGDTGLRAVACALAMQSAMRQFTGVPITPDYSTSLTVKAAVATGSVRRFQVGDPQIQVIDALAGATLNRLAATEHHAEKGEVVLDPDTASTLSRKIRFHHWRADELSGVRFGVVGDLLEPVDATPWPNLEATALPVEVVRPWLLPPVYERLVSGQGEFLAEFRPAATIFLRFGGIDYDGDEGAGEKLDAYIRQIQKTSSPFDGSLIQLTIGDKGSYLQVAFGAPIAHEDYVVRAVATAQELRQLAPVADWAGKVQIGIAMGHMRTGAYGGSLRRTYGVLGNETNLAARLMTAAAPGQVLASEGVQGDSVVAFTWDDLGTINVKGRADLIQVYSLRGAKERSTVKLQEPRYSLPMVGRETELALIEEKIRLASEGQGQIVGVLGEAGIGKSRLLAEVIHLANKHQLSAYGGECQSYGMHTSYLVWQNIWRGLFALEPSLSTEESLQALQLNLGRLNPDFLRRLPLLGPLLNLPIPDNDLTRSLDAKLRKASLESLLVDCLSLRAREAPLLLVLENVHWIDPLSYDLLGVIGRAIAMLPVMLVMAYRPFDESHWKTTGLESLPYLTTVSLTEFTQQEAERLIRLKLEQLYGAQTDIPVGLFENITRRAQGNPFYIEELLNFLRDRDIDLRAPRQLEQLDLPVSLHSLILTRIDQRSESEKVTLKIASIIGRIFIAAWLWGAYPELGDQQRVKADLDLLDQIDLTPMYTPEPELTYLFKHIITQEVAYESLPFATRAILHDQLAQFVERTMRKDLDKYVDLLAFHYEQGNNQPKMREYLRKAGELAQKNYANESAIRYYQKLLPLLSDDEQIPVTLKLGQVLELMGRWSEAHGLYQNALKLAERLHDDRSVARCRTALGELFRKQGSYAEASSWLELAMDDFEGLGDREGLGQVLHSQGTLAAQQGQMEIARTSYEQSLTIRHSLDDKPQIANLMSNLGILARMQGDYERAGIFHMKGLDIRREIGDRFGIASSLNNLGYMYMDQGDYEQARLHLEEALSIHREIGSKFYIAIALNNLGNVMRLQGDYDRARRLYTESLQMNRELGDGWAIAYLLEDIGCLEVLTGQPVRALKLVGAAFALREKIGAPLPVNDQAKLDKALQTARESLSNAEQAAAWAEGKEMTLEQALAFAMEE
jgi:adenylate cyclase